MSFPPHREVTRNLAKEFGGPVSPQRGLGGVPAKHCLYILSPENVVGGNDLGYFCRLKAT